MNGEEGEIVKEALKEGLLKIWKEENDEHERVVGEYYPSGIGACIRKQYYEFVKPKVPSPETLAVFATGRGIHEAVAEALSKSERVKIEHTEFPVRLDIAQEVRLSGRIDVLLAEVAGKRAVLEVKSVSRLPVEPHENHILQLQAYLHALDISLGLLLYWDKRTGELICFNVNKDASWLQKIGERVVILDQHLKVQKLPHREAFLLGRYWECDRCPYLEECMPFSLQYVPPESRLAVIGVSTSSGDSNVDLVSPDMKELKELCRRRKSLGEVVIILADIQQSNLEGFRALLDRNFVQYDSVVPMPATYRSATFWKLEFARRLARNYRIAYYADSEQFPESEAIKFSSEAARIGLRPGKEQA